MKQEKITINTKNGYLSCIIETPTKVVGTAIVMHGRKSNKEREGYLDVCQLAHKNSLQTIRFDFRGHGKSYDNPNWEKYGVVDQLDDLREVVKYLRSAGKLEGKLILVASSFSAEPTLLYLSEDKTVEMAIIISPGLGKNSSGDNENQYRRKWWDKAVDTVQISFSDYKDKLGEISQKVHALHGDSDISVPLEQSKELRDLIGANFILHVIKQGEHKYTKSKEAMMQRREIIESLFSF